MIGWFFSQSGGLIDNWCWTEVKRVIVSRLSLSLYLSVSPSHPRHSFFLPSSSLSVSPLSLPLFNPLPSPHLPTLTRFLPMAPEGFSHWLPFLSLRNDFVTLLAEGWCQSPSPAHPPGAPPTSMACVKHTHMQTLLVRGQGQKLINQILLSAVKPLSLPACILNKTALKHIDTHTATRIPSTEPLARNTRLVWGLGQCGYACTHAFVCESVCKGTEVAEGLDGWQRERTTSKQAWRTSSIALSIFLFPLSLSSPLIIFPFSSSIFGPDSFYYLILFCYPPSLTFNHHYFSFPSLLPLYHLCNNNLFIHFVPHLCFCSFLFVSSLWF